MYGTVGEADLNIGVIEGDPAYVFSSVADARTPPSGGIVVVDGGLQGTNQELRIFDSEGRHLRTIGRRGKGPGEFTRLTPLAGVSGDTIWTWDNALSRLTWFRTDGEVLGERTIDDVPWIERLTRLSDGRYLAHFFTMPGRPEQDFTQAVDHLWTLDAESELQDSLRNVGEIDAYASGPFVAFPPFGRFPAHAAGADRIYTGWNGVYRIMARSLAGDPKTTVSAPDLERPVDPAEMDPARAEWVERCPSPDLCTPIVKMFDAYELPTQRPAFSALQVDDLGDLWVAEYDPRGNMWYDHQGAGWHVFSPEGDLLGRVAVPPGLVVTEIGADYVLGVQTNELDVQSLSHSTPAWWPPGSGSPPRSPWARLPRSLPGPPR